MTGIVFDIEHFATRDGPGIRTVVFLKGCPLRCAWCHNPESWNPRPEWMAGEDGDGPERCGRELSAPEILEEVLRDKPFYDHSGGGLTLSGGEPLMRRDFALALLHGAKDAGLHVAVETSGAVPRETVLSAAPFVDLWLWDVKLLDPARHLRWTGGELAPILSNLEALDALGAEIVLRRPLVPGVNDDPAERAALDRLAERLRSVRAVEILPYHSLGTDKARRLGRAADRRFPLDSGETGRHLRGGDLPE